MISAGSPVDELAGVGPKRAEALAELEIYTVRDLLFHLPYGYEDRRDVVDARDIARHAGEKIVCRGVIDSVFVRRTSRRNLYMAILRASDDTGAFGIVFFGSLHSFAPLKKGRGIAVRGAPEAAGGSGARYEFVGADYVLYDADDEPPEEWLRLVPLYPACASVPRKWLASLIYRTLPSVPEIFADDLPGEIAESRSICSLADSLRGVHSPSSPEEAQRARRSLAYRELLEAQLRSQAARDAADMLTAPQVPPSSAAADLAASLPFGLTDGQRAAIDDICRDMARGRPMRRLLQGDVGSGKTIVALAAAAAAHGAGLQTAVMLPTTVLSAQFWSQCVRYLGPMGVRCGELRGAMGKRARDGLIASAASGEIDILVGTHALLEDDVRFASLGLVVIDEQHRFGVRQRETLISGSGGLSPHTLLMSATPIPRTLCMALCGDLDISVIRGRPAARRPVVTKAVDIRHADELADNIAERANAGERAYWVCPMVDDDEASVEERARAISRRAPSLRVGTLYGSMTNDEKRASIDALSAGEIDLLVSTTVVEVGVDVPDAVLMVIESASRFGLSTLHQLRGRVGRGEKRGICVLLDTADALRSSSRIAVMLRTDDGFEIAEEDLRERGSGDAAGTAQHGWVDLKAADLSRDADLLEMAAEDAVRYKELLRGARPSERVSPK